MLFFQLASRSHIELRICRFKYDAQVVQCALFPHLHQGWIVHPVAPAKRRKIAVAREVQAEGDAEMDPADEPRRGVVLECPKETFLVTQTVHEGKTQYTLSVLGPLSPNASQPCPSTLSIPPADTASKTQDTLQTSLPEPSEEGKTSIDDPPPLSGATTDAPGSTSRGKETDEPPSISCPPASAKPTVRVLRSNLSDGDFAFEKDTIVIKSSQHHMDNGKMVVDGDGGVAGDALEMRVLRWRWYSAV
jgi:hypothetical protein